MSDDADRVLEDLKIMLQKMPEPHIDALLDCWQSRVDTIRRQLNFTGCHTGEGVREAETWEKAIRELKAASLLSKGHTTDALELLLNTSV